MKCPSCERENQPSSKFCVQCGRPLKRKKASSKNALNNIYKILEKIFVSVVKLLSLVVSNWTVRSSFSEKKDREKRHPDTQGVGNVRY